jgi:hypothetical protein
VAALALRVALAEALAEAQAEPPAGTVMRARQAAGALATERAEAKLAQPARAGRRAPVMAALAGALALRR